MSKIIVFGTKDLAQLANYYISHDTADDVVAAFTVDEKYLDKDTFEGKPVVPFETLQDRYSPDDYLFFAPMTGSDMNRNRERVYQQAKQKGYKLYSYISSKATVLTNQIGENCFILEDNTIQPFVTIGNNVVLWSGNHIGHHSIIEDHVFFTSQVVLSGHCHVKKHSWFGVNATIRDGLTIEEGSLIAMSASVTKNTKPWSTYLGIPAKSIGKDSREANP